MMYNRPETPPATAPRAAELRVLISTICELGSRVRIVPPDAPARIGATKRRANSNQLSASLTTNAVGISNADTAKSRSASDADCDRLRLASRARIASLSASSAFL